MIKYLKYLILFLCFSPLLASLYIAAINLNKPSKIRILTWQSSEQNIGTYIAIASLLGFSISSLNSLIFYYNPSNYSRKTTSKIDKDIYLENDSSNTNNSNSILEEIQVYNNEINEDEYLTRDIREPSPTISVPFRIIKRTQPRKENIISKNNQNDLNVGESKDFNSDDYQNKSSNIYQEDWFYDLSQDW